MRLRGGAGRCLRSPRPRAALVPAWWIVCRARLLALADRLQAVEEEARAELREVAAALGEPADYDAFLEHQIPGTPHHELYRCAESFELGAGARAALTSAAAATEESMLAEWKRRRAERDADRRQGGER